MPDRQQRMSGHLDAQGIFLELLQAGGQGGQGLAVKARHRHLSRKRIHHPSQRRQELLPLFKYMRMLLISRLSRCKPRSNNFRSGCLSSSYQAKAAWCGCGRECGQRAFSELPHGRILVKYCKR